MDGRCPRCWNRNVTLLAPAMAYASGEAGRRLLACADCEKWFWEDSGEEVGRLFEICVTSVIGPGQCSEDIRALLSSGGATVPRRRQAEFNQICSRCRSGRFAAGRIAAYGAPARRT